MQWSCRHQRGFTLLELMTVVAIIGTLAAVAIPAFIKYIRKAKTAEAMINLPTIVALQKTYRLDHGKYLPCPPNPPKPYCDRMAGAKGGDPKLDPKQAAWASIEAWEQLGFRPDGPQLYQYQVKVEGDRLLVEAVGDLDCDKVKSRYWMDGRMVSPAVERELE